MAHGVLLEHGVAALAYAKCTPSRTLLGGLRSRPTRLLPVSNPSRTLGRRPCEPQPAPPPTLSERRARHGPGSVDLAGPSSAAFRPMAILRPGIASWRPGLQFPRLKTPLRPREGPRDRDSPPQNHSVVIRAGDTIANTFLATMSLEKGPPEMLFVTILELFKRFHGHAAAGKSIFRFFQSTFDLGALFTLKD